MKNVKSSTAPATVAPVVTVATINPETAAPAKRAPRPFAAPLENALAFDALTPAMALTVRYHSTGEYSCVPGDFAAVVSTLDLVGRTATLTHYYPNGAHDAPVTLFVTAPPAPALPTLHIAQFKNVRVSVAPAIAAHLAYLPAPAPAALPARTRKRTA